MITPIAKAEILIEALPYIKEFYGKTVVIKYGGNAMINEDLKNAVMQDVVLMKFVGINPIIVHGGGPEITAMLKRVGKETQFIGGLRVTDKETMEIAEMVLVGKINKEIVSLINQHGGQAIGLSGKDANLIKAAKRMGKVHTPDGKVEFTDIGFVGDVAEVNPEVIQTITSNGYIPVISPVGVGEDGQSYNVNADYVAGEVAAALKADKLVMLTDVEGIFEDFNDKSTLISSIHIDDVPGKIAGGIISGGMIPKVECCVQALRGGVEKVHIIDGRVSHSILLEIFTKEGIGTMVVK